MKNINGEISSSIWGLLRLPIRSQLEPESEKQAGSQIVVKFYIQLYSQIDVKFGNGLYLDLKNNM